MRSPRLALLALLACALLAALPAPASAGVRGTLSAAIRAAGPHSGIYVADLDSRRVLFRRRAATARILASNTKLFTTAAALGRLGGDAALTTEVRGDGTLGLDGVYRGNLYLVGGGDPTFGTRSFGRSSYGGGGAIDDLADALAAAGIVSVTGRVLGDESRFDSRRGGPDSGYRTSIWVGPLSALSFNRGLARTSGSAFQTNPPLFAARALDSALAGRFIDVRGTPRVGVAPPGAARVATERSPSLARVVRLTNKPSDNFFAEILLKDLALDRYGRGTTRRGAALAALFARLRRRPAHEPQPEPQPEPDEDDAGDELAAEEVLELREELRRELERLAGADIKASRSQSGRPSPPG
jgi:D-alanyl-D-alanine carboxypeptidase/D-alanyl-D-alanine-endopeptidase (penicillin-binding protein 4)